MTAIDLAACRAFCERRDRARQFTNVGDPIAIDRPTPVLQYQPEAIDNRPHAASRDPCPRCNIRGDLGCAHQAPYEAVFDIARPQKFGRGQARASASWGRA